MCLYVCIYIYIYIYLQHMTIRLSNILTYDEQLQDFHTKNQNLQI